MWVGKGSRLGQRVLYPCQAAANSQPHTHTLSIDHTLICLYVRMCMYTCTHWHVYTFVYLCVLISINAHGCVFMCTFLFWERVWNISAQIRECCGDHCCVFQNHDYFLSCLRRKSKLYPPPPPPHLSLRELLCVCRCIHTPVCMACMHICVASQCIKRNTPCVAFSSLFRASPLSHVIMENPTASHTSDKTQSPV